MKRLFSIFFFFIIALSSGVGHTHPKDELEAEIFEKYGITVSSHNALNMAGYLFFLKEFLKAAENEGLGKRYFPHANLHQIHVYPEDKVTTTTISGNFIKTNHRLAEEAVLFLKEAFPLKGSMEAVTLSVKNQAIRKAIMDKIKIIKDTYKIELLLASAFEGRSFINEEKGSCSEKVNMETIAYEHQNQLLEGLVQLIAELEAGNEPRKKIYLPLSNDSSNDPYWDFFQPYWFNWERSWSVTSTEVIDEYMLKVSEELGYVVPKDRKDGTMEYLVLPSLVTIETVDGTLSNTLKLSVLTELWISISPWYQLVYVNMLKNFFELKLTEALKTGKKVRIKRNGWKSPFEILDIEDEPAFEAHKYMDHGVDLDPEIAHFEIFPGKITATCVGFYYDGKWIASECYNFQSSAQKIKELLDKKLILARWNKTPFRYFPITLLDIPLTDTKDLAFEESFIFSNDYQSLPGTLEGMNFVFIPKGTFQMGSPSGESGRSGDETLHSVTLSQDFEMMTTEVTQKQWLAVMGSNPSHFKGEDRPVETVSWNDIQAFIQKLNEGNASYSYRLPTEAEWEYAARAGTQTPFSFDDKMFNLIDFAWFSENAGGQTQPVAQKKPNAFGLYDIHGNVWEWVLDVYSNDYSTAVTQEKADDVQKSPRPDDSFRVCRGGSWNHDPRTLRSAYRNTPSPAVRGSLLGFRVLRVRQESAKSQWLLQLGDEPYMLKTTTGAVFTRVKISHPVFGEVLGEAWRDPDGLIWGDIKKNTDGSIQYMNHYAAMSYCTSNGARLPSEDEFTQLREYMGARSGTEVGYSAQVLPNLSGYRFWSSTVDPSNTDVASVFDGSYGFIIIGYYFRSVNNAVRCVVDR